MLHVLKITMHAPNGCYSKASSLNHLFLALPKGGQRLCGEEKQAKILPITSVYGARTKDSLTWKVIQRVLSEPNGL